MHNIKIPENTKIISLDIFDTAIIRETFRPKDIYDIIESRYGQDFKALRMQAENIARESNNGECTLDSTFEVLSKITNVFNDKLEEIKQYEVELEILHCRANPPIWDFYNKVKDKYQVIFISDMYLNRNIIGKMLEKSGYEEHPLYVSGEVDVNKSNGGLYHYVLSDLKANSSEIFHIGDNYRSDGISACKHNIHSHYIINNYDQSFGNKNIKDKKIIELYHHKHYETSFLTKFLTLKENTDAHIYNKIGYYWGAVFYNFTKWVLEKANGRRVLFNSRDGHIPYHIAKNIMGYENCEYVYFARRSSSFIAFDTDLPINHEKNLYFYNALRFQRVKNIRQLLGCIGLESSTVTEKILQAGFTSDKDNIEPFKFDSEETHAKIEKLLISIQDEIYDVCKPKKAELLKYIESLNLKNDDVFCDIGYNGSIQYGIELLTGLKLDGKYFEVYKRSIQLDCVKEGYLSNGENLTYGYGGLLESIFSAPHGGVIGYEDCKPLLFHDFEKRIEILNQVHKGIIEFCENWHELTVKTPMNLDKEVVKSMVMRFLKSPSIEEALYGMDISFDNGSEDALETITWFNEKRILQGRILECYNRSYWKEAFLELLNNSKYSGLVKYLPEN